MGRRGRYGEWFERPDAGLNHIVEHAGPCSLSICVRKHFGSRASRGCGGHGTQGNGSAHGSCGID